MNYVNEAKEDQSLGIEFLKSSILTFVEASFSNTIPKSDFFERFKELKVNVGYFLDDPSLGISYFAFENEEFEEIDQPVITIFFVKTEEQFLLSSYIPKHLESTHKDLAKRKLDSFFEPDKVKQFIAGRTGDYYVQKVYKLKSIKTPFSNYRELYIQVVTLIDTFNRSSYKKKTKQFRSYNHVNSVNVTPVIGVKSLSRELAKFIVGLGGETPLLIGLFGRWGRGKTFLFEQVWNKLASSSRFIRVDFHAWKYQETPASWGYLYESLATEYYKSSSNWFHREWRVINLNWHRDSKGELLVFLGISILSVIGIWYQEVFSEFVVGIMSALGLSALISKGLKFWRMNSTDAKKLYKKYSKKHNYTNLLGLQAEIQKELKTLLKTWLPDDKKRKGFKRILLFVDDLDRCSEDRIIQVIDSLRIMLEDVEIAKRLVVIIAVDERILRRAIRHKYSRLLHNDNADIFNTLIKEYFDKLFLATLKLGNLNQNERNDIFESLTQKRIEPDSGVTLNSSSIDNEPLEEPGDRFTGGVVGDFGQLDNELTQPLDNKFELSQTEAQILGAEIELLEGITPRQIRIFYIRYLFGRDFIKSIKKQITWQALEIRALSSAIAFLYTTNHAGGSIGKILSSDWKGDEHWKKLSNEAQKSFSEVLDIVVPY